MNNFEKLYKESLFLKSALSVDNGILTIDEIVGWLEEQSSKVHIQISKIPFLELNQWQYRPETGSIEHGTGRFFKIEGIEVRTNWGSVNFWKQPIINQPEVGILGLIAKEIKGVLHFLMQAKIEPGNINYVQLSPTLQATRSNFTAVHRGKAPAYLNYFLRAKADTILLDQLQSEQGGRFLRKRNRNIIIRVDEDFPVEDNFTWVTLGQLKRLMDCDNLVNMDTRTVVAGITFGMFDENMFEFLRSFNAFELNDQHRIKFLHSAVVRGVPLHSIEDIITFITKLKSEYYLDVSKVSLTSLDDWSFNDEVIQHKENKYFRVVATRVEIENREVSSWTQPMVEPAQEGLCAFVCKEIKGILHFAVQAKLECGNFDIIELAPTVQCLTGNYRDTEEGTLPFLEYVLNAGKEQIVFDTYQSEEGGRFFREQNRNMIVMASDDVSTELPDKFIWMTLAQLHTFLKFNNYLNIQARSLIAAISFV